MYKRYILLILLALLVRLATAQTITITGSNTICVGQSTTLHAEVTGGTFGTTSYNFENIDYNTHPEFSGGTAIDPDFTGCTSSGNDDCWAGGTPSNVGYDIGFSFCFFNQQYTKFYVGSNGWVGFTDPTGQGWTTFTATEIPPNPPNPNVPKNCIFAPWQDWYPGINGTGNCVFYYNTGTAPNRKLVVYWNNTPLYQCQNDLGGSFMIVLNEQTSIIENFIMRKPQCMGAGAAEGATQGVLNLAGDVAFTATGRNFTVWTAFNEGTRFVPSGIIWYKDALPPSGTIVGYGPDISLNPNTTTTYFAVVGTCNGGSASDSHTITVNPLPANPMINGLTNVCQGSTVLYTTEPGFFNYSWNATTGTIVSMTNNTAEVLWNILGTQNLYVTYTTSSGCYPAAPGQVAVSVNPYEVPVITGDDAICAEETITYSTQTGKTNYLWSYPGATVISGGGTTDNTVTLKWMTAGMQQVSVNYTDVGGCTGLLPVTKNVTVNPKPVPVITGDQTVCISQTGVTYSTESGNSNYLWSYSPGAANVTGQGTSSITLDWTLTGSEWVMVTYTNSQTCTGSSLNYNVTVNPLPVLNFPVVPPVCVNSTPVLLNMATPAGGTYTGPGVSAGTFDPSVAGVGTHVITYTYTDADNCTNATTRDITVNPLPVVTLAPITPVCVSDPPITLVGGSPSGGTFSGPGVTAGIFDPAAAGSGTHTITYTYSDINGCTALASTNLVVNPLPIVTLADLAGTCVSAPPFALNGGDPLGGSYSGPGVSSGIFSPATAGIGTHPITYTYTNLNGCTQSATKTIQVYSLPVITFDPIPDACIDHPAFLLTTASPAGGIYSGPGVSAGTFDPSAAGAGIHTITYNFTDGSNCTNSATQTITVNSLPVVTLQPFSAVCISTPPFILTGGAPAGGSYTGAGISAGVFDPAAAGTGTHTIIYTFTDVDGCTNSGSKSIIVNQLPSVNLADFPPVCITTPQFQLSGGTPSGGTYSGPGVSAGNFSAITAGIGNHSITYTFTDANGCTNAAVKIISVNALPDINFTGTIAPAQVCQDFPTPSRYEIPAQLSTTFTWTIPAPFTDQGTIVPVPGFPNIIDVNWTGAGSAQLKLEAITSIGCQNSKTNNIIINPKPVVGLTECYDPVTTTNARPFLLKGGTPLGAGGNYYIDGILVSSSLLDPGTLVPGSHTISYTYTNVNGCPSSDSKTITVAPSNAGYLCFNNNFTDPRNPDPGTNRYPTLSVTANGRTTCWMLKNLNWGNTQVTSLPQTDNCTFEKYCVPGDNNCTSYGALYQWDELMQYGSTPGWPKGVCPPGWHVPTSQEWQDLIDANQGNGMAGGNLKDPLTPQGFQALLDGFNYFGNLWAFTLTSTLPATMFWTSSLTNTKPVAHGLNYYNPSVSIYESSRANAFPVRCVKD